MKNLERIIEDYVDNSFSKNNLKIQEVDFIEPKMFYNENGGIGESACIRIKYQDNEIKEINYLNLYCGIGMRTNIVDFKMTVSKEEIDFSDYPVLVYGGEIVKANKNKNIYNVINAFYDLYMDDSDAIYGLAASLLELNYFNYNFKISKSPSLEDVNLLKKAYEEVLKAYKENIS
jgi:hypothetical protein